MEISKRYCRLVVWGILELEGRRATADDIAAASELSRRHVCRVLNLLMAEGVISRTGNGGRGSFRYSVDRQMARDMDYLQHVSSLQ